MNDHRVALVTGAGRGIGRGIAERLAADGLLVVVAARSGDQIEAVAAELRAGGLRAESRVLDVTDAEACRAAVRDIVAAHGRLDVLVNSAGTSYIAPVLLGDPRRWREVLDVNLFGAFALSRAVLRPMVSARSGRIVHIGSISSQLGAAYNAIYAASKAGVDGLVRSLALEVAQTGITVNAVAPGYVRTELFEQTQGTRARLKGISIEEQAAHLISEVPIRRLIEAPDVAAAVSFLASEAAGAITGQVLNVDGGRTAL